MPPRQTAAMVAPRHVLRRGWAVALLCLGTGLLWQLCFAPLNVWPLAYGVLAPWGLAVCAAYRDRTAILCGWLGGAVAFGLGTYWLTWITLEGYVALVFYLSLYWLLAAWAVRRAFQARWAMWIVLPVLWVGQELARSYVISGFPWFFLAHSQYQQARLIQITDVTGVYGVSFFVAMVNGLLIQLLAGRLLTGRWNVRAALWPRRHAQPGADESPAAAQRAGGGGGNAPAERPSLMAGALAVALTAAGLLGYGTWRLSQHTTSEGPTDRGGAG